MTTANDQRPLARSPVATTQPMALDVLLGLNLMARGPSYTLVKLLEGMASPDMSIRLYAPQDQWPGTLPFPVQVSGSSKISNRLRLPYRLAKPHLTRSAENLMLRDLSKRSEATVYTWGEVTLGTARRLKDMGHKVVREKFNCAKLTAKRILDDAYGQFGLPLHNISSDLIEKEIAELSIADAIFCPSPEVTKSLLELNIPPHRLLPTSYGWEPDRFSGDGIATLPRTNDGPVVLFVGFVCVRKGAHLLLEAWRRANIKGHLVLVGGIEPFIATRFADVLSRDDVSYIPYTPNIGDYYRAADWFIFPTLEEGGPQVTYEAAGLGLPVIVSTMGAGAFARDNIDGLIVKDQTADAWTDVISSLPDRQEDRVRMGAAAAKHALDFTYDKVGARRRDLLIDRFGA